MYRNGMQHTSTVIYAKMSHYARIALQQLLQKYDVYDVEVCRYISPLSQVKIEVHFLTRCFQRLQSEVGTNHIEIVEQICTWKIVLRFTRFLIS